MPGGLSEQEMRRLLEEYSKNIWQSGGVGRIALREELLKFSRIFFDPYQENSDLGCVYPITDDDLVYTSIAIPNFVRRFKWSTGETVWKKEVNLPFGIDYDNENRRLVAGYSDGIFILNADTGETVKNITDFGPYSLAGTWPRLPIFNPDNPSEIYFSCIKKHVVVKLNWETGAYTMFGTWGTAKSDLTGFDWPYEVEVNPDDDIVYVADRFNNRVLLLNMDLDATKDYLYIMPRAHSVRLQRWGLIKQFYGILALSSGQVGVVFTHRGRRTRFMMPLQAGCIRFNPDLDRVWATSVFALEVSLRNVLHQSFKEKFNLVFLSKTAVTAAGVNTWPVLGMLFDKFLIRIYSNQTGTLYIQVPDSSAGYGMGLDVPTDFTWVNYADSIPVDANVVETPYLEPVPPVFRLRFVPSADATVTMEGFGV